MSKMNAKKTILALGHIPTWAGGLQSSGLASVIYQQLFNLANSTDLNVVLASTDIFEKSIFKGKLRILGWNKIQLIFYAFFHPRLALILLYTTFIVHMKFGLYSFSRLYIKRLFLLRSISIIKPDIVHLHSATSCFYIDLIKKDIKIVVTLHGVIGEDNKIPEFEIYRKQEQFLSQSSRIDCLVFITNQLVVDFKRIYGKVTPKMHVILNAYDQSVFYFTKKLDNKKDEKITLCTIASISNLKGQLRVLLALKSYNNLYRYICIGSASQQDIQDLDKIAIECNIEFQYLGIMKPEEIRLYLSQVDYMILPSSSEGFGLVFLESIACGVPVILPKNLPIVCERNLISDRNSILLNDCTIESIKSVLDVLPNTLFDRDSVSKSITSFSWSEVAKEYEILFQSL